tara:strand:- start:571 stop:1305 length:735 start_codon:yes stop_codon:yes gene_type:complete
MIISIDNKTVFFDIPKCASSSIVNMVKDISSRNKKKGGDIVEKHMYLNLDEYIANEYKFYTVLRDPFEWYASQFSHQFQSNEDEAFLMRKKKMKHQKLKNVFLNVCTKNWEMNCCESLLNKDFKGWFKLYVNLLCYDVSEGAHNRQKQIFELCKKMDFGPYTFNYLKLHLKPFHSGLNINNIQSILDNCHTTTYISMNDIKKYFNSIGKVNTSPSEEYHNLILNSDKLKRTIEHKERLIYEIIK